MKQNRIKEKIFILLKKEPMHQRGIERVLGINQTNVRRALISLEKENIVDKKRIGKSNNYFIKNSLDSDVYEKVVENYKLLEILNNPKIRKIVGEIYSKMMLGEISLNLIVVLFGSYAKNLETKESDVDLYIDSSLKKDKKEIEDIDEKINVVSGDLGENKYLFEEIRKNHIVLNNVEGFLRL